jgi:hypothetical protein
MDKEQRETCIIGAINYLSSKGLNAFSFLTFNVEGDDQNCFMYTSSTNFTIIDVSKTAQWEIVFEHADSFGLPVLAFQGVRIQKLQTFG